MNDARHPIGDLARRTGLTVKAIRYYADRGLVPPAGRTASGRRVFDARAVARLDLLVTLRDLGLDLATIRRVLDRQTPLSEVAAAHADALDVQIRVLRRRRAVLAALSRRPRTDEEMTDVHRLARMSADERRHLIDEYLTAVFGDRTADPAADGIARSLTPELPDDPDTRQLEAWVEWAGLSREPGFRDAMRTMAAGLAADRPAGAPVRPDAVALACAAAAPAVTAGVAPESPHADAAVAALTARYARDCGRPDGPALRRRLLDRLTTANDPRRERHLHLLSVVNGWPDTPGLRPLLDWSVRALRARPAGG